MQRPRARYQIRNQDDLRQARHQDPDFSSTLAKGLMILQCFRTTPRPLANSEIADRLGLPRPTVSRLCRSLQSLGFLDHDERLNRYFVGPVVVTLGYPYVVNLPLLTHLRPALQALADRFEGAASVGVVVDLDVIYIETCTFKHGTFARPRVGAIHGVIETAIGRAWLATREAIEQERFLERARRLRPDDYSRCLKGLKDSLSQYSKRGFAINLGDAGMGILAAGVASNIQYGSRNLLFNCAVPGYLTNATDVVKRIGPALIQLVNLADRQIRAELMP